MDDLKKRAFDEVAVSINRLGSPELVEEAFSVFASRQDPPAKIVAQLLTHSIDTQNFMISTLRDSNRIWHPPSAPGMLFGRN